MTAAFYFALVDVVLKRQKYNSFSFSLRYGVVGRKSFSNHSVATVKRKLWKNDKIITFDSERIDYSTLENIWSRIGREAMKRLSNSCERFVHVGWQWFDLWQSSGRIGTSGFKVWSVISVLINIFFRNNWFLHLILQ